MVIMGKGRGGRGEGRWREGIVRREERQVDMQMGKAVRKREGQMNLKEEGEKREKREGAGTWTGADGDREIVVMGREEGEEERGDVGTEIGRRDG